MEPVAWHERSTIGGVIAHKNGGYPSEVLSLEPEHFTEQRHAHIWTAVAELIGSGEPTDAASVYEKLVGYGHPGLGSYLVELGMNFPLTANLDHHAKKVWGAGQQRLLKSRIDEIVKRSNGESFEDVAGGVLDAVRATERICEGRGLVHMQEPLREALSRLEKQATDPDSLRCCSTGLRDLDEKLTLEEGAMTIVAGRPGMGKTAFAAGIARDCARDITKGAVAMFSLEMSAVALVLRLMSREARVESKRLTDPRKQAQVAAAINRLWGAGLYFDDRGSIGPEEIHSALSRIDGVRLVVVDYLQLAKLDKKLERQDLRIGAVTKGLKRVAKAFSCHVLALSQLNRAVESRNPSRPQMSDLRDSGNIEEDADNVLFLYRDEYYEPETQDKGVAEVIIAKQRNGPQGVVRLAWMPQFQTFADLAKGQ